MNLKTNAKTTIKKLCIETGKRQINSWSSHFFHQVSLPKELEHLKKIPFKSE